MRLKDIENIFHQELDALYNTNEVNSFFNWLIEHYLSLKPLDLIMNPEYTVTTSEEQPLFEALSQLKIHKPIQYIIGSSEFYGLSFKVNEHTLIPRPETEDLVSMIISEQQFQSKELNLKILDVGTGSGCIAVTLAKYIPNAKVVALDISEAALELAKQNAELNKVNVSFLQGDILKPDEVLFDECDFDMIVSNPPYVRHSEKNEMRPNVLDHEPHQALFVEDNDPLLYYRAICEFSKSYLKKEGRLFFEINEYLGDDMITLLKSYPFNHVELIKDLSGKDRFLKAIRS